ncbi:MAG TPA: FKBP-type peptidyl-prolyl cis-trans isomerase [Candidatus Saccharimonadia bacterium]|nr:FKBP-type peptidyl-prolyl cis-trans isomerase [Candidatus Saccharimonadia bacterium]
MADTRLRDRGFALVMAVLFGFTAVATSAVVIYSVVTSNQTTKNTSSASSNKTKLAGTKLIGFTPVSSVSTLQVSDIKVGTGSTVTASSTVSVQYTGALAETGIIFQSSLDQGTAPITFALNQVITGWQEGMIGMKVGGERQMLIPASLAYGATPPSGSTIPANAPLVFDVTLLAVK